MYSDFDFDFDFDLDNPISDIIFSSKKKGGRERSLVKPRLACF
jgi:hypothetical protein